MLCKKCQSQRNDCQKDADSYHTFPLKSMPESASQERTQRTSDEISGHENRIDPVGSLRHQGQRASLIADLHTLHTDINNNNANNKSDVSSLKQPHDTPGQNNERTADIVQLTYT